MKLRVILYICVLALFAAGCEKRDIEKVELTELNGDPVDLTAMKGKTVFINFWATWCTPCIKEMPTISEARQLLKDKDVIFLLASIEETDELVDFVSRKPFDFHYVLLHNARGHNISVLPTTFIFDEEGNLKFSEAGARNWNEPENLALIAE